MSVLCKTETPYMTRNIYCLTNWVPYPCGYTKKRNTWDPNAIQDPASVKPRIRHWFIPFDA